MFAPLSLGRHIQILPRMECAGLTLMEETKVVTIVIAAGYPMVRDGLVSLCDSQPNFEVLAQASDGATAELAIEAFRPDIAILDMHLQGLDTFEVIRRIRLSTSTRVVVLADTPDRKTALDALRAGALGFMLKSEPSAHLFEAIPRVSQGAVYLPPDINPDKIFAALDEEAGPDCLALLSGREYQVFLLLVEGLRAKEIAIKLELSPKTVDTYRASLMRKLEIFDVPGLVKFAIRRNLIGLKAAAAAG